MPHNKQLTNRACSGRTGEYWPWPIFYWGILASDQYSPVQPSRSVSIFLSKYARCDWSILPYGPLDLIKFDQHLIAIMSLEEVFEFDHLANDTTTVCSAADKGWFVFSILKQAINQRGITRSVTYSTDLESVSKRCLSKVLTIIARNSREFWH